MRFVLRSERHLADLRAALPRLLADLPSARVVTANLHPEHKAVLEGDTEVALTDADPAADAGRRRHPAARPEVVLPDQHRGGRRPLPPGPRLGRRRRPRRVVWDLYCGVGGFALHATAPGRTVLGVETSAEAVEAARARHGARGCRGPASAATVRLRGRRRHDRRPLPRARPRRRQPAPTRHRRRASPAGSRRRPRARSSTPAATSTRWPATSPRCRRCAPSPGRVFDMFPQTPHTEVMVRLERR